MFDSEQFRADCGRIIDGLPLSIRKYAGALRVELHSRVDISLCDSESIVDDGFTPRQLVAACVIDLVAMGEDSGGFYIRPVPADYREGFLEWRAIFRAACELLEGEFSVECDAHNSAMSAIDAQFSV